MLQSVNYNFKVKVTHITGLDLSTVKDYYTGDNNTDALAPSLSNFTLLSNNSSSGGGTTPPTNKLGIDNTPRKNSTGSKRVTSFSSKLDAVWKRGGKYKGRLEDIILDTKENKVFWRDEVCFQEKLTREVSASTFHEKFFTVEINRTQRNFKERLARFKIDLATCINGANQEKSEYIMDVPSKESQQVKATIFVAYNLLHKCTETKEDPPAAPKVARNSANYSDIVDLRKEITLLSSEFQVVREIVVNSQKFTETDFWKNKVPGLVDKVERCIARSHKLESDISFMQKKMEEVHVEQFPKILQDLQDLTKAHSEKLLTLTNHFAMFTRNVESEIQRLRTRLNELPIGPGDDKEKFAKIAATIGEAQNFPFEVTATYKMEKIDTKLGETNTDVIKLKEKATELEEALRKFEDNLYFMQKSNVRFYEEITGVRLTLGELRILQQKYESLEYSLDSINRVITEIRITGLGNRSTRSERVLSVPVFGSEKQSPDLPARSNLKVLRDKMFKTPPSSGLRHPSHSKQNPRIFSHWFMLDHFVLLAEPQLFGERVFPAYYIFKYYTIIAELKEVDGDVNFFDCLFASLYYVMQKSESTSSPLIFWLANSSFLLKVLENTYFNFAINRDASCEIINGDAFANNDDVRAFLNDSHVLYVSKSINKFRQLVAKLYMSLVECLNKEFFLILSRFGDAADPSNTWLSQVLTKLANLHKTVRKLNFSATFTAHFFGDLFGFFDATLFKIICSNSQFCTPQKGSQMKYLLSELENWACSDHPELTNILERLCHVKEAANLLVSPKENLANKAFRERLFPNLSTLQLKHLLTIFSSDSSADKIPPSLLSTLSSTMIYGSAEKRKSQTYKENDDNVFVEAVFGNFGESETFHFVDTDVAEIENTLEKDDNFGFLRYLYGIAEQSLYASYEPPTEPVNPNSEASPKKTLGNNIKSSLGMKVSRSEEIPTKKLDTALVDSSIIVIPETDTKEINNNVNSVAIGGGEALKKDSSNSSIGSSGGGGGNPLNLHLGENVVAGLIPENASDFAKKIASSAKSDFTQLSKNFSIITSKASTFGQSLFHEK